MPTPFLALHNITLCRGTATILSCFSLTVNPSEIHWVLGANGVGKTSLLKAAAGLLALEEGEVQWNGLPISHVRAEQTGAIHYLGHNNGIKMNLSVEENLKLAAAVSGFPVVKTISAALEQVGLAQKQHRLCRELSAGQQRRVALARLAYLSAKLWILDEPFTTIDEQGHHLICDLLTQHINQGGAILASTHRLPSSTELNMIGQQFLILERSGDSQ